MFLHKNKALSDQALTYFKNKFSGNGNRDARYLKELIYRRKLNLKNFDSESFDFEGFDWINGHENRNWWWQMQALPFIAWSLNSYALFNDLESEVILEYCLKNFIKWKEITNKDKSPLCWHDHATALRLNNLINWALLIRFVYGSDKLNEIDVRIGLFDCIIKHINFLKLESNYSKSTNHGFDQSFYLLIACLSLNSKGLGEVRNLASNRLVHEIEHAFTDEGVHKENSPGYQKYMLSRIRALADLDLLGERYLSSFSKRLEKKIEKFLSVIALPDRSLPLIGDTQKNDNVQPIECDNFSNVYNYANSGYVVVRGTFRDSPYHFIMKNTHDSNYHRHDDDLSIHLFYKDSTLIGDGGLFSHDEKDKKRRFLRSVYAHSIPIVNSKAIRDRDKLVANPSLKYDSDSRVITGTSYMFGTKITRMVDVSKIETGVITIKDISEKSGLYQNFLLPFVDEDLMFGRNFTASTSSGVTVTLRVLQSAGSKSVYTGWNRAINNESAICSSRFSIIEPATRFVTSGKSVTTEINFFN